MDQSDDTCVTLVLDDARTVATADETLLLLREALHQDLPVTIDCTALTASDLSFIQLLLAGQRAFSAAGRDLAVRATEGGPLEAALKAGGFLGSSDICDFITFTA
ncbi:STAS domain-containing protein [Telmatospirillum siberiense]|uniref:Anti-anti-sigma factor n=1 Tax=Telmatospirillum siberiense TaxID=382514 RepID=A0A2N3PLV5_9PROT|nr:STAS domain-containing protein [Telmatospirillum siberiense]PKU21379.1 anti-anti-sigma factor [Telmatospirillum siberiense]